MGCSAYLNERARRLGNVVVPVPSPAIRPPRALHDEFVDRVHEYGLGDRNEIRMTGRKHLDRFSHRLRRESPPWRIDERHAAVVTISAVCYVGINVFANTSQARSDFAVRLRSM